MPSQKYLFLLRSPMSADRQQPPSPAQMQEMFAAFNAWKEKFKDNIVDMGDKLEPGGKVADRVGRHGRAVRRGQGDRRRIHDRRRRELRARARGREGGPGMMTPGARIEIREIARPLSGEPHRAGLVEHFFRHEYGRLVATLARMVGVQHLEVVEDAVQTALHDRARRVDGRRTARRSGRLALPGGPQPPDRGPAAQGRPAPDPRAARPASGAARRRRLAGAARISPARCATTCCGCCSSAATTPSPRSPRLVLALKTLCGFSTAEIALRLFTSEANVHKRLARARERLREIAARASRRRRSTALRSRLPSVHAVLYLLFNEGYLSAHAEQAIRRELCDEAIRLATLLAEHPVGAVPETFALLALMHLHAARLGARLDGAGWPPAARGAGPLALGSRTDAARRAVAGSAPPAATSFSRFHAEAGIAAEHCFAPSFARDALEGDRRPLRDAGAASPRRRSTR